MTDFWIDLGRNWIGDLSVDLRRYVIFAVGVAVLLYVVLGAALRGRKIREETPPARQWITEFFVSVRSIAIFSTVGLVIFLMARAGLMPLPEIAATWGPAWFAVSLIAMIVGHDAYFYWVHRTMHRPQLFRMFHRRHHLSHNTTPFTAYSFDLAEAAVMAAFVPLWLMIFPTTYAATGLFMLHQIARNTLGHAGYELMPARRDGRPLFDFLTTATHHNLHHRQARWNHGLYFTWWDRWMGTEHPEYHAHFAAAVRKPLLARPGDVQSEGAKA
ncbi:sterol desaturase family protein [soil metagenome]